MAPQLQQCGAPTWWPRAGRPAQPALSCQRCWLTSPQREVLEPTSYLGRWAATGAPRGLLNGAVPCWPLNYSGVVRPQWSRGGGLIVHPADPLTTAVWCATWAPGPGLQGVFIVHPSGPLNMAVRCMWCARLRPRGAASWRPITAVAWGAHLGPLQRTSAIPECGVPAWAPGELL